MNDKLGFVEERVQSSEYRVQIYIVDIWDARLCRLYHLYSELCTLNSFSPRNPNLCVSHEQSESAL